MARAALAGNVGLVGLVRLVGLVMVAVVSAGGIAKPARAEDDGFARPGCYLGASGAYANPYRAEGALRDLDKLEPATVPDPNPNPPYTRDPIKGFVARYGSVGADVDRGWTLSGRAGCRSDLFGGEVQFEWIEGFSAELTNATLGKSTDDLEGWVLTANAKLYPFVKLGQLFPLVERVLLNDRIQPVAIFGVGYMDLRGSFYGGLTEPPYTDILDPDKGHSRSLKQDRSDSDFVIRGGGGIEVYLTRHWALTADVTYVVPTSARLEGFDFRSFAGGLLYRF